MVTGFILLFGLIFSLVDAEAALLTLTGPRAAPLGKLAAANWAQAAITFGMHSYADIHAGVYMIVLSHSRKAALPRLVTVWNTTRFVISFLWLLKLLEGMQHLGHLDARSVPPVALFLIVLLAVDACLVRPVSVYLQRELDDKYPPKPKEEADKLKKMSFVQKCCRGVFYYESVISGCSGATYFVFPQLFMWLYGYPAEDFDYVSLWCLSQFGVLVMTFGLYQMSTEIDQNAGMVLWWLLLDYAWMYYYWAGTAKRLGPWNPFLGTGATFWCHAAFHADSTLALARMVYLLTLMIGNKDAKKASSNKQKDA